MTRLLRRRTGDCGSSGTLGSCVLSDVSTDGAGTLGSGVLCTGSTCDDCWLFMLSEVVESSIGGVVGVVDWGNNIDWICRNVASVVVVTGGSSGSLSCILMASTRSLSAAMMMLSLSGVGTLIELCGSHLS